MSIGTLSRAAVLGLAAHHLVVSIVVIRAAWRKSCAPKLLLFFACAFVSFLPVARVFAEDAPSADRLKARLRMQGADDDTRPMYVAFAPDGKTVVTATFGKDRTARLW